MGAKNGKASVSDRPPLGQTEIVGGGDYNFNMGYEQPVDFVEQVPGLTGHERKLISSDNAGRLLKR